MYIKAESVGGDGHAHSAVDDCESLLSDEECPGRLKSVVVVQERTNSEEKSGSKGPTVEMETDGGGAKGGAGNSDEP